MRKLDFLIKLKEEGTLELVEPSAEIMRAYLGKSESNLISAKILFQNNRFEESVSIAYYSMYHFLTALLFRTGIKCENHSAAIFLLKELFGIDNSDISFAKRERIDKQYYVDFKLTAEQAENMIKTAERFSREMVNFISKLNNEEITALRAKFNRMIGGNI